MMKLKGGEQSAHAGSAMTKAMGGAGGGAGAGKKKRKWAAKGTGVVESGDGVSIKSKTDPTAGEEKDEDNDDSGSDISDAEDDLLASLREKRMAELKKKTERQQEFQQLGHGKFTEIVQDEFLKEVTKSKYVVCHFFHSGFERCKIMDKHLEILAPKHLATKFVKINAEKAPFFVGKLQIKVLPTVVLFKDGIAVDRVVGFEELGAADDFKTAVLEKRIAKAGCLIVEEHGPAKTTNSIRVSDTLKDKKWDDEEVDDD